jgi:hypothetical protein
VEKSRYGAVSQQRQDDIFRELANAGAAKDSTVTMVDAERLAELGCIEAGSGRPGSNVSELRKAS